MFARLLNRLRKPRRAVTFVPCPHCGGDIRNEASFCRHCGSSDADGWSADEYDAEDDFDYDQYVEDHHSTSVTSTTLSPIWRAVVVVLVIAFVASLVVPLL